MRILICDPLHAAGLDILRESGADLHQLTPEEKPRLAELVGDFDAMVVRSATMVTAELLKAGRRLKVVGRAGIGVDNVDVATATELGILVVNAPTANMMSATEHTFALLLSLARRVPAADASIRRGEWDRKGHQGVELQGKRMGVIGFGRIGQQVAERARAFGMEVVAYDPFLEPAVARKLGVELLELDELLARSDVVTLHTPLTDQTRGILSAERIAGMRDGALLVNCARGGLVDEAALLAALEEGRLGGAALDVFSEEPPVDRALVNHPRVVSTPHIGAQTVEAQERIATQTARMLLAALEGSLEVTAVNLPFRPAGVSGAPFLALGEGLGRLASSLLGGSLTGVDVDFWGIDKEVRRAIGVAVVKGALTPFLGEAVNYVNAEGVAKERGISVVRSTHDGDTDYPHQIRVTLTGAGGEVTLSGVLFRDDDPRVVEIEGFRLEFRPEGRLLVLRNRDVPGVVGKLGTVLGQAGVNIAGIHLARRDGDPEAMAVVRLDQAPGGALQEELAALPEVLRVQFVDLGG